MKPSASLFLERLLPLLLIFQSAWGAPLPASSVSDPSPAAGAVQPMEHNAAPLFGDWQEQVPSRDAAASLTPSILGMPRYQINLGDRMLRLFNGRGAISVRDKSLTGLQMLQFPPIDIRDYRFSLAFREANADVLIQDVVPDVYDHMVETGE